jgi:hypothetical protein
VAEKVAEVAPAGTVTDTGTVRAAVELDRATADPPDGAALERATVQVVLVLAVRLDWPHWSEVTFGGSVMEKVMAWEEPLRDAVRWAV